MARKRSRAKVRAKPKPPERIENYHLLIREEPGGGLFFSLSYLTHIPGKGENTTLVSGQAFAREEVLSKTLPPLITHMTER